MKYLVNLAACLFFTIIFKEGFLISVTAEETSSPEIAVTRYKNEKSNAWITQETSLPDTITKDGDDYIVTDTESVSSILLTCKASYPVYWVMTDVKPVHLDKIITNTKVVIDSDGEWTNDVDAKEFISYLEVYNDVSFSGLYTCRSVESDTLKTSTYIFLPGYHDQAKTLLHSGEEIEVGINGMNSIVIPCKASKKDAVVTLLKKDLNGTDNWSPLSFNTTFDPKQGFTVETSEFEQMVGNYKCSVADPAEEVIVNVIEEFHKETEFHFKNDIDGKAKWGQRIYGDGVECCSNDMISPDLLVVTCENIPECDMKKTSFMHLLPKVTSKTSGVYPSTGKGKHRPCSHTTGYFFVKPFIIQCIGDGINFSGQYAMEYKSTDYEKLEYVPSSSIQNMTYNIELAMKVLVMKWKNITKFGENYQRFSALDLNKGDEIYSGERFVVDCCGLHYHHAIGRIQRIVWKNGTITMLTTPEKEYHDLEKYAYVKDFCYTYQYDAESEDYLVTADENMSHFECIVPRWYDKKPGLKRIPLNIRVPTEPVIMYSETVENVTYNENQVGLLQLECNLSEGIPPPKVTWAKDGYKLNQTDIYWSVVKGNSNPPGQNLLFMRATKDIEGEYECTAHNWKGTTQKSFIVKVNPRSYLDYWIALVIFGGFFAVIICCALRISTLEKQTTPKQVEPVSFRAEN